MAEIHARPSAFKNTGLESSYHFSGADIALKGKKILKKIWETESPTHGNLDRVFAIFDAYIKNAAIFSFDNYEKLSDNGKVEKFRRLIYFKEMKGIQPHDFIIKIKDDGRLLIDQVDLESIDRHDEDYSSNVMNYDLERYQTSDLYFDLKESYRNDYYPYAGLMDRIEDSSGIVGHHFVDLTHALGVSLCDRLAQMKDLIRDSLDPDILYFIDDLDMSDIKDVSWLTGGDGVDIDVAKARQQALKTYPLLISHMFSNEKIINAVEKKEELAPVIADLFDCKKSMVKRIEGLTLKDIGEDDESDGDKPLHVLDNKIRSILNMPERFVRQKSISFDDLEIIQEYGRILYHIEDSKKFLNYLSKYENIEKLIQRMKDTTPYNVGDSIEFLVNKFFIPAALNRVKRVAEEKKMIWKDDTSYEMNEDMLELYSNYILNEFSMKQIFDLSDRYHKNIFRYEDILIDNSAFTSVKWEPMIGTINLGSGYIARELHSVIDFKQQGREQDHCVGGYANSVLNGANGRGYVKLVFSIEKEGHIESTFELECSIDKEKDGLVVMPGQNSGKNNAEISQEAQDFSDRLVEKITQAEHDQLKSYLEKLNMIKREFEKNQIAVDFIRNCGYNPWNRDILEKCWKEFASLFPARIRHQGLDDFIDAIPLRKQLFYLPEHDDDINIWEKIENEKNQKIEQVNDRLDMN